MRTLNIKRLNKNNYVTSNGKIKIRLTARKGHVHVSFSGIYSKSGLTNVTDRLNSVESMILVNYLYMKLERNGYVSKQDLELNYAEVFGSCFSIGSAR